MVPRRELHIKRLQDSLSSISGLRSGGTNAHSPSFESWQERTAQSLRLFGQDSDYTRRFRQLRFWLARASMGQHMWAGRDQEIYTTDLQLAEEIIKDALEELSIAQGATGDADRRSQAEARKNPQVVLNVTNILSQVVDLRIEQVISRIDGMALSDESKVAAKQHAVELRKGNQRTPTLADTCKANGRT